MLQTARLIMKLATWLSVSLGRLHGGGGQGEGSWVKGAGCGAATKNMGPQPIASPNLPHTSPHLTISPTLPIPSLSHT